MAIESAQAAVASSEAEVAHWQQVRDTFRGHLGAISLQVHPWRLEDSTPQSTQEVEAKLAAEIAALQELLEVNGLAVKKKVLNKGRKQLADLAAVMDVWWQTVRQDVHRQITLTPRKWPLRHIPSLLNSRPRCWWAGKRGQPSMPRPFSGPRRRWKAETAICLRCITLIGTCPSVATRCGGPCTTSMAGLRTAQRRPHGFSGGTFPTCLKRCCPKLRNCHGLASAN